MSEESSPVALAKSLIVMASDGFTGLNTALQFVSGLKNLIKDDKTGANREVREKLIDLTDHLLTVREQNAALRQSLLEMKEELDKREQFDAEAENYALQECAPNAFAYVTKGTGSSQASVMRLCAHCFGKKQKSVLQFARADYRSDILSCTNCGAEVHVAVDRGALVTTASREDRGLW